MAHPPTEIHMLKYRAGPVEATAVKSVVSATSEPYDLHVHNNDDGTRNMARIWNALVRNCHREFVVIADSDIVAIPGWLDALFDAMLDPGLSAGWSSPGRIAAGSRSRWTHASRARSHTRRGSSAGSASCCAGRRGRRPGRSTRTSRSTARTASSSPAWPTPPPTAWWSSRGLRPAQGRLLGGQAHGRGRRMAGEGQGTGGPALPGQAVRAPLEGGEGASCGT